MISVEKDIEPIVKNGFVNRNNNSLALIPINIPV
jgi:hypothetical protein